MVTDPPITERGVVESAGLAEPLDVLDAALAADASSIAVVGDPYSRRDAFLDAVADRSDVARVRPASIGSESLPDLPDASVVIVSDCQRLFARCVGGFDAIDALVERVTTADGTVVTAWNRQAWEYIAAVRDVGHAVEQVITLPRLDAEQVEQYLDAQYEFPTFAPHDQTTNRPVTVERVMVDFPFDRTVAVPVPRVDIETIRGQHSDRTPREAVFDRVARLAHGNPAAAAAIWERSISAADDGILRPSDVVSPVDVVDLDDESAFVLWVVLTKEQVPRAHLDAVTHTDALDRILAGLRTQGVLTVEDDTVSLAPAAVGPAIDALARRRLLW